MHSLSKLVPVGLFSVCWLGTDGVSKTDETSENFQTAFDPPRAHLWKIILQISRQKCVCSLWRDCCLLLYDPPSVPKENYLFPFQSEKSKDGIPKILKVAFEVVAKQKNLVQEGIYRQNENMNLILGLK